MSTAPALVWFRDDLRLSDNPALDAAVAAGRPVATLFVLDDESPGIRPIGGARRWWLAGSLRALAAALARHGVPLILRAGPATRVVPDVAAELGAALVAFTDRAGGGESKVDHAVAAHLADEEREVARFCAHLLHPPGIVRGTSGALPKTFSAFHRAAQKLRVAEPLPAPERIAAARHDLAGTSLDALALEPRKPDWAGGLRSAWTPGETAAQARLADFIEYGLSGYREGRDRPAAPHASRLSPHLAAGDISLRQVLAAVRHAVAAGEVPAGDAEKFEAELYWREFSHHVLAVRPNLATRNIQDAFDAFPWRDDTAALTAWQRGMTGYPIVDAGMRQLWIEGWMPNRVRMVVASFLTKHLAIDWREGDRWFWDTLVDADPASNAASWQWVAGSGLDAAPYFRIFNPVLQGEKFDPDGAYVRRFVPELDRLPDRVIHRPFEADARTLSAAGVRLGETYPKPIVDHAAARARALAAFETTKK